MSPVQEYLSSGLPRRGSRSRKCCPTRISLWSRWTLRGDAERAALVSGVKITTKKTSPRKPARAPTTDRHLRMNRSPARVILSRASPSQGWRRLSHPDRPTKTWFHTEDIFCRTAVTGTTPPLPARYLRTSKGSSTLSLRMTILAEMNRSRYSRFYLQGGG
jgi:hypothetical protein